MFRYVAFGVLLSFTATGFGQIDPAAKPFLGNMEAAEAQNPVRTLDYTLCLVFYTSDDETETCIRTAMDFAGRRMLSETRYGDEIVTELVYADGAATMTDPISGEPTVLPKNQAAILEQSFRYADDLVRTGGTLPDLVSRATYDGVRRYGNVVRGEQVTVDARLPGFLLGADSPQKTTMQFIFGSDKALLAIISNVAAKRLLNVLENPTDPVPMRRMLTGKTYRLTADGPKLESSQRLARFRLNPNLADALFTFGNGEAAAATSSGKRAPAKTPR